MDWMNSLHLNFPWADNTRLDAHAHLAPDVTRPQLDHLGDVLVLAVTRSLSDAERVSRRRDDRVIWGCGTHPSLPDALESFDPARFERLVDCFALVGEVGLDRKFLQAGAKVLKSILRIISARALLVSLHGGGAESELLAILEQDPPRVPIMHWYSGEPALIQGFVDLGCYFSVNARTPEGCIELIPASRILTETDYPATRRQGVGLPGATSSAEEKIALVYAEPVSIIRRRVWENFTVACSVAGVGHPEGWPSPPQADACERTLF